MRNKQQVGLVVFDSHHLAFQAEMVLKQARVDYPFRIVPAPRHLSLSCDYALQVPYEKITETERILKGAGLNDGLEYHIVN